MTIQTGMSKRSLLLLGGLTAAVTNPTSRQKLLDVVGGASDSVQALYQDTVKPLAQQAQQQLQESVQDVQARTQELAHMAAERGAELAQVAAERGSELVQVASERGAELAQAAAERGSDIAQVAAKRGSELTQVATERGSDLAQVAAKRGSELVSHGAEAAAGVAALAAARGGKQVQGLLSSAQDTLQDTLQDARKDGGKVVEQKMRQGHKQALKLQKELAHEIAVRGRGLDKLSGKRRKQAEKELAQLKKRGLNAQKDVQKNAAQALRRVKGELERSGSPMTGVLIATGLLVGGGVLLARVPAIRHGILRAVGSVSPEAAEALHAAGTSVRDIVGSVWMERIEPETATAAPAPKPSQATGSAAYASVEPGSPAQETPPAQDSKPAEGNTKN
ncbi:hypothetical protein [Deinococcus altitudinis]|uniref:hypothetical protein n=1 Tax=Deinococcus altitudinis TaxID=468914 RepID=UPI003891EF09